MRVSVIGATGQLGTDLVKLLSSKSGVDVHPLVHDQFDVCDLESVKTGLGKFNPDWVVNTAAFHKLLDCEQNPERAFEVNSAGAKNVAVVANELGAKVVHISTDYVFRGDLSEGDSYTVKSETDPVNVYGKSKLAGEQEVMSCSSRNSVVRIASVFGAAGSSGKGGNFVEAITAQLRGGKRPVVVAEGRMSPTYTLYAAGFIAEVIARNLSGIFHGANQGSASWFDFADQIARFTGHEGQVDPILGDWDAIPSRPRNSSLAISRLEKFDQPSWQVALSAYLTEKGYLQ